MFTVFKFCPCGTKITFILLQKKSQWTVIGRQGNNKKTKYRRHPGRSFGYCFLQQARAAVVSLPALGPGGKSLRIAASPM
jgi:hypothetical protein